MKRNLACWLIGSFILVVIFGTIYGAGQFVLRSGANDPQVQTVENIADKLSRGSNPTDFTGDVSDARYSPTFFVIYDEKGGIITGSGFLNGGIPTPPHGIFDYAKAHKEDRFTWQPQTDVRLATVVLYYNDYGGKGFVLAARSLKDVEKREDTLLALTALGGLVAEAGLTAAFSYRLRELKRSGGRKK